MTVSLDHPQKGLSIGLIFHWADTGKLHHVVLVLGLLDSHGL
jgi:hypothetical protein